MDSDIDRILTFWFSLSPYQWFVSTPDLDTQCKAFTSLIAAARSHSLDSWTTTPRGTLALLILLDQFPRNIHRGTAEAFASDSQASSIATLAIARGQDREVALVQQMFFYLPLMHDERLLAQVAAVSIMEAYDARLKSAGGPNGASASPLEPAKKHLEVILRFGRFPARNGALGRESTHEEKEFLRENPRGL